MWNTNSNLATLCLGKGKYNVSAKNNRTPDYTALEVL